MLSYLGKPALVKKVWCRPRIWPRIDEPEETNKEADTARSCKQTQHVRDMTAISKGLKTFKLGLWRAARVNDVDIYLRTHLRLDLQGRVISRLCQRAEDAIAFRESNEDM